MDGKVNESVAVREDDVWRPWQEEGEGQRKKAPSEHLLYTRHISFSRFTLPKIIYNRKWGGWNQFLLANDTFKKMNKPATDWGKYSYSEYIKKFCYTSGGKGQLTRLFKWAKAWNRHIAKENIEIINMHGKKSSGSLVITQIQVKIKTRYHYWSTRAAKIKKKKRWLSPNVGKNLKQLELPYIASVKWQNHPRKCLTIIKLNTPVTRQLHPKYLPKRNENIHPHEASYVNVHSSFIHNSPKLKIIPMSISKWRDTQITV